MKLRLGCPGMGGRPGMGRGGRSPRRYPQRTHPEGKKILEQICRAIGERLFEVSKKQMIDQIYDQIQEGLRNQYSLGYTPDRANDRPSYHKDPTHDQIERFDRADPRWILRRAVTSIPNLNRQVTISQGSKPLVA